MSSVNDQLKQLANDYAEQKITRRQLWKGAAALGLSGMWIAALEKGALAGPAPVRSEIRSADQDRATTLIIAVAENIDTFDPAWTVGSKSAQTALQNVFDQLTQYQIVDRTAPDGTAYKGVDTENIIGMIAESWEYDPANTANMVFKVRPGVTYTNGNPINANTLVEGYKRVFDAGVSKFLLSMGGAITDTSAFVAEDESTFVIKMSKPNTLTAKNNVMHNTDCIDPVEVAAHATPEDPYALEYFKANLASGNGPYKLESYKPDDSIVLVANETYYGEQPAFTTVIMKIVADATQRVQLLTQGDVDTATKIPIKEYEALKANPDIKTLSIPTPLVVMLELNGTVAPFDNKLVRQAVAYATPYADIIEQIYLGQAAEAKSLVPAGMPTSDFSFSPYVLDYEKAKALLAEAGYPEGEGLPEVKLTIAGDDVQKERIAILMQDSLKNIGIEIGIEKLAYAQFNELQQGSKLQMWTDEWISWVNDPFYHLSWLAQSASPNNYPKVKSDEIDALIAEFTLSDDAA
ncbi:MAG: ABC transporter substrate-binding protein, partial [Thermomicrobiales bacterium]|nr:ABC transporter substrate-binding protein [Thermomicrobiales bacterium]